MELFPYITFIYEALREERGTAINYPSLRSRSQYQEGRTGSYKLTLVLPLNVHQLRMLRIDG
jgi:hypothetical protein